MSIIDKTRLLQTSMLSGLMMSLGGIAYAQTADEPIVTAAETIDEDEDEFESDDDEIVVTGSRLRRNEFTSASPLQVIDGELARDLGLVDAADLLGQTTVVQGQQITTGLSTSAGNLSENGPGSATASLRGLSPGRTLVLVNGRRLAPAGVRGVPSAPDLNLIPGTLIERVDVLLDGASSIYGSDAVAGVVNYQLRSDFDGIQLDAFATMPELRGNAGAQEVYTATAGVSSDKGFIGFAVEHSEVGGFAESAFSDFYEPYSYGCLGSIAQGVSGEIYAPDRCTGSFGAGAVSGPFGFLALDLGANNPGLPPNFRSVPITASLIQPDDPGGQALLLYPEELDAAFAPDFERNSIFTIGEYDTGIYGDMTAYFEASYAERKTDTNTAGQGRVRMPSDYLFNDFGGGSASTLYYRSNFVNETNVAQTRIIGGLKGDLPFLDDAGLNNWGYDAYASYSRSSGQDRVQGVAFFPRLEQTLANTRLDPVTGEAVCDSRGIAGEGQQINCRPLDFLDPSFILTGRFDDPLDNEYLFPNRITDTEVEQTVYSGYIGGDLFDIPTGGTVLVGMGAEYREDKIATDTALAGEFFGFFDDPGSNGKRNLTEFFGEIELPLVDDLPGIHDLTLNLSGRLTDESNFGSAETYAIKGTYSPVDYLTFRGTYGTSFRAPDLGQQFGGRTTGFANPGDPCRTPGVAVPFRDNDNDPTTPDTREYDPTLDSRSAAILANCTNGGGPFAIPGTDITSLGIRGLGTANPVFFGAPTRVASGSNPNLDPETSQALSLGVTFDQPWTDKFDLKLAVTYFEIKIDDEIDQLTANTIVNRCYQSAGLTDPTCAFITRDPRVATDDTSGEISFVSALNQNLGQQVVEGIDYNAEFGYTWGKGIMGDPVEYNLIFRATQSLTQTEEQFVVAGIEINDDLGEYGNPEWRLNITNQLRWKDFGFLFQSRYLSSMIEDNREPLADGTRFRNERITTGFSRCVQAEGRGTALEPTCTQFDDLADYWVHNASINFTRDSYVLRVGVNNVFDNAPPLTNNNSLGLLGGIGYDLGGRTFFANATKKF